MMILVKRTPWYLWPFVALWRTLTFCVEATGRVLAVLSGFGLMVVGALLSLTVIGAIVGIPLAVVGFLLVIRGLF
jgi:hypothetical protein